MHRPELIDVGREAGRHPSRWSSTGQIGLILPDDVLASSAPVSR